MNQGYVPLLCPHIVIRAVVEAHLLKMNSIHPNRSEKTLQLFGESIFLSLKVCYERLLVPEAPASMGYENFIANLRHLDHVSIENPLEILKYVIYSDRKLNDQQIARAPIGPVVLGAIFAFRAFREFEIDLLGFFEPFIPVRRPGW